VIRRCRWRSWSPQLFCSRPTFSINDMVVFGFVAALLRERADDTMRDHWLLLAVRTLPVTMMCSAVHLFSADAGRACRIRLLAAEAPRAKRGRRGCGVAGRSHTCRGLISGRFRPSPRG
jgi:hypothetical protein